MKKKDLKMRIKQLEVELNDLHSFNLDVMLLAQNNKEKEVKDSAEHLRVANEVASQTESNVQLKESEERFLSLADNVPLHIFIIEPDEEANISYWNKSWLDYIGQNFEQAIGNTWGDVIHPDDVQGIMEIYLPAFENRQPYFLPGVRVRRYDAQYRWHSVKANPRYLPNGKFMGYIGIGVDIHESKLAQDELKASEEHFRKMADLMPAKISNANTNGDVTYYNKNWLDFTGFTFEELRDFGYHQIMHPDEMEEFAIRLQKAAATGTDLVMEMRLKNKAGDYVWHLNIATPVKDENGNHKMWVGVTTDISDQKKQREELEKAVTKRTNQLLNVSKELEKKQQELFDAKEKLFNEYARSLIEASPDPLFTISSTGEITDFNEASSKITGISIQKLKGTNFINYFTDPEKALKGYKQVFEHGFVANYPLTIKDVNQTPVLFNGSVYKDGNGNVIGAVAVARVITEQKRFEKELTEAKIAAENAAASKQQFLSNMSHEIRTPLNSILGFTNVLLKTALDEKQKEFIDAIKTSGTSLNVLINDILDLAKVEAGKMSFEKQPFEIQKSIKSILHSFELKMKEKNLKMIREYDSKIPLMLLGDSVRLNQIIINLMSNAVKFTHNGTIILNVKLLSEDQENVTLEFAVTDSGIGIAEDKINSIFKVFEQAEISTSNSYGGTGLGLAIVKQLIESQGGNINLKSKLGEGSTFSFTLTFGKTNMRTQEIIEIPKLDSNNKNISVLVAEDIPLNQLLIKLILNDFGFEHEVADNGKIALEKLRTNSYDIILMDLQMPEMNGFEATEYIRKTMKSNIPIIALSADVTTVDISKCKEFGMDDYISKPINENLLYTKIVELVKQSNIFHET
ncbi:PAS domain-containing hybrid sensor histidine kinase/response regulator [Flavobacterium caseinilyticum]|uniref:Sensory/regulatory protein RpfC n=1 Tax=Flavobacterium caseinilyticum TaxID=2541732 RepID=A0A4R5B0C5_9FLAO|nr:PAS domain-containing hybrid sensor histidine kinase/response regulator [Flavobacterium caseinilyticum]TDD76964.1 PAS domain-containing sensor histidine kinase [Flavobacterium caseinilyticum]